MADLPNDFWSGWIIVITVLSFIGMVWLVFSIYFSRESDIDHTDDKEPVWDKNLREGLNPAPLWWFWLIFAAMIFSVIYLMLYPGLGAFKGALNWSQDSRIAGSYSEYQQKFSPAWVAIENAGLDELQGNADYMDAAENLFSRHCAACHGYEAQGQANMFPNLRDDIWQWGGAPEQIEQSIVNGRRAAMVAWGQILGDDGINQVADYVQQLSEGVASNHPGHTQFTQFCAACHNTDGTGNPMLGAPNLTDNDWLYGGELETIKVTLRDGRNGVMPAFGERLDGVEVKLLVAWLTQNN